MMRKYFPLEASERLFVAIEEDDVVDAQVSLPPTIALSCTTEIIHDNYALCLQFWLNGVNRQELLRLVRKQAKGDELTADERKQFKYMRARYKHLRFAQRLYLKKHQAGFLFGKTTVFLGRFQDGFRNGKKNIVSYYGNLLRIYLSSPVWSLVNYSLRHSQLESVSSFIAYRQKQMHTLKEIIAKPRLTGREFHDVRKIISQQVSYYDTLRSLDPENKEALQISRFLAAINGLMGDKHDDMVADDMENRQSYDALVALVAGILWTVSLGAIDEWVASPLQQQALQIKSTATALGEDDDITGNMLWARRGNEFVTVKSLNEQGQPVGVEIFHYRDDLSLESYIYARSATIEDDKTWILHGVNHKKWLNGKETLETLDNLAWQSAFTSMDLEELSMPGNTFSVRQLNHYIHYLQETGQPSSEYRLALWEKLGQPILTLAMILLAVPFTFSAPRSPGMGSRLAVGVIVGLLTWISYQIMVNLGLLFALSAPVTALGLPIAFVLVALSLVYWYDRQH